jgi:hypothetical protein
MKTTKIITYLLHFAACVLFAISGLIDLPLEYAIMAECAAIFLKIE